MATLLTADAENNVADDEDCADWATAYGSTHPILADDKGFTLEVMAGGYNYPFYMLIDRGMVVEMVAEGEGSVTESDITALL